MTCPGCASEMQNLTLDGKLGTKIAVDVCVPCRVVWFDHLKELQLAPQGTLTLFGIIAAPSAARSRRCRVSCAVRSAAHVSR